MPLSVEELERQVAALSKRNEQLVTEVMQKSAQISELRDQVGELGFELDSHIMTDGHNRCWVDGNRLHKALGKPCPTPDPKNVSLVEFLIGCANYAPCQFATLTLSEKEMCGKIRTILIEYQAKDLASKT